MTTTLLVRRAGFIAALLSTVVLLTGCSSIVDDNNSDDASANVASSDSFPVTVNTAWGELTLHEKPERIVAFSARDVEILSSLNETVSAFSSGSLNTEEQVLENYPWLDGLTESFDSALVLEAPSGMSLEAVAAYEPDLILSTIWATPEDQYERFSQIAPTYVGRDPEEGTGWEETLTDIGALTGKTEEAEQVLGDVEAAFVDASERLPGLQGKTYSAAAFNINNNEFVFTNAAPWLQELGLVPGENQPAVNYADVPNLSLENLNQLNGDVLLYGAGAGMSTQAVQDLLEADPRFSELPASQNEAVIVTTLHQGLANTAGGPVAKIWLLEEMLPKLEELPLNKANG